MPPMSSTAPRSIANAIGGDPGKPRTILNLVPMRSFRAVGMNEELLEGTLAAMMIGRCLASSIGWTVEVCQTRASAELDTVGRIRTTWTGPSAHGPTTTWPSGTVDGDG